MKFYLTVLIAAFMLTATLSAQHVNIGIKGGLNVYNIKTENTTAGDSKMGFYVGLLGHIHLSDQFGLQPELLYSAQGGSYKSGSVITNLNLNYINVPVLIQYMFDNGFRLQAGPQFGFLLNAESETNNIKTDLKDSFKPIEIGASFGMSYVNPPTGFGIDARYNIGLSNINENSSINSVNRGFQIGVFYLFGHKS
jgi:hypothetical protein